MGKGEKVSGGADGRETMCGGVLERGEGLVLLQALRDVLRALITNRIAPQTASESGNTRQGALTVGK